MKKLLSLIGHKDWLRFGVRARIIRVFHNPDTAQDEIFELPFFGRTYRGNFNTFIDWNVFYFGAYAKEELLCMSDFLEGKIDSVIVDAGANVGHHTLFASTLAKHVHSFEPFPPVAKKLMDKVKMNGLSNVTLHEVGLGNISEFIAYTPSSTTNTGTGGFFGSHEDRAQMNLEVCVGDDYFKRAGITNVDFVKMDIEGFELNALTGMRQTLQANRPVCFIEWSQKDERGRVRNGTEFFPPDYLFYEFRSNESFMGIFSRMGYRLTPLDEEWCDGNLLALPKEYVDELYANRPRSAATRRLRGE